MSDDVIRPVDSVGEDEIQVFPVDRFAVDAVPGDRLLVTVHFFEVLMRTTRRRSRRSVLSFLSRVLRRWQIVYKWPFEVLRPLKEGGDLTEDESNPQRIPGFPPARYHFDLYYNAVYA